MPIDISNNQLNSVGANVLAYGNIVTDGLVLYLDAGIASSYPGSGTTWYDLSTSNYNGTLTNGPTFNTSNGGSIVFDGVDDYANFGNINITSGTSITVEVIVKPQSTQGAYADILDYDHTNSGFVIQQDYVSTNQFIFGYWNGSSYSVTSNITLTANVFNTLCFTKSGTTVTSYLNGVQVAQNVLSANFTGTGKTLFLSQWVQGGRFFNGNISSVKMYNKALSASEVLQNFNANRRRFNI